MEMMGGGGMGGMMGGSSGTAATPQTIATIEYRGRAEKKSNLPRILSAGPTPLVAGALPERTFQLGQGMMMGMGRGMSFTINGREFEASRIDSAPRLATVEDWVYINATTMDHPMHLHTNAFQLVQDDGTVEPAWRDVILVKAGQRARFRVRFEDFAGKTVQHCHISSTTRTTG
jgi:FtsP/CotA-like multicopper oxidase with cupredoxin domain